MRQIVDADLSLFVRKWFLVTTMLCIDGMEFKIFNNGSTMQLSK